MNLISDAEYFTILEQQLILPVYQPIVSVKRQTIPCYEALVRGVDSSGNIIPPNLLFAAAESTGTTLTLDRLCRSLALSEFSKFHSANPNHILSININTSILDSNNGSNHFINTVDESGISRSSIMIEILESESKNLDALCDFVKRYKSYGFLIAIDDIGSGFSNLERIISVKPDVLKIDSSLINDINNSFYKREVVKAIIAMAHGTGSVVVAEGVETADESAMCLELGADLLQGYYFSKPYSAESLANLKLDTMDLSAGKFRENMLQRVKESHIKHINLNSIVDTIIAEIENTHKENFNYLLDNFLVKLPEVECLYIINPDGIQISNTCCNSEYRYCRNSFFNPDPMGTDQSYKDYFFYLKSGLPRYTSSPYISGASGNLCSTISASFTGADGSPYVLCCDIRQNDFTAPSC